MVIRTNLKRSDTLKIVNGTSIFLITFMLAYSNSSRSIDIFGGLDDVIKDNLPNINTDILKPNNVNNKKSSPPQSPVDRLAGNDIMKGALFGAATGGVLACIFSEDCKTKSVLIGATAGGVAGAVAGKIAADRRAHYNTESQYLEAEIASANNAISKKNNEIASLETQTSQANDEVKDLERRHAQNINVSKEASEKRGEIEAQIAHNNEILAEYEESIAYLNESIKESEKRVGKTEAEKKEIAALRSQLANKRDEISAQYARLNGINEDLEMQNKRLLAMK